MFQTSQTRKNQSEFLKFYKFLVDICSSCGVDAVNDSFALLGAGDVGKSTLFKQLIRLYSVGRFELRLAPHKILYRIQREIINFFLVSAIMPRSFEGT